MILTVLTVGSKRFSYVAQSGMVDSPGPQRLDADVVADDADTTPEIGRCRHQRLAILPQGDVGPLKTDLTDAIKGGRRQFGASRFVHVSAQHTGAGLREARADSTADALGTARDDDRATGEVDVPVA